MNEEAGTDSSVEGIRWAPIDASTDIVIEGFPRSANTYAVVAFRFAQERKHRIAYRLHAPIQLMAACRAGIPAIALIRNPKDAVLSWVIHRSDVSMEDALMGYESFYKALLPYRDKLVVADFKAITNDYGTVIRRVNEKYGTDFQEFPQSEENVDKCFSIIDEYYSEASEGVIPQNAVARPSEERKKLKEALKGEYDNARYRELKLRAEHAYSVLIEA
ncbi:hypothetical protein [Haloferula sp.]|uniref:hypothetical protein n=1 Tax=Haloferula sp. TaxID=2497595 RepID=UPI00329DCE9A